MRQLYLPYKIDRKINYVHLIKLFSIATYNTDTKSYDTIKYNTQYELAAKLGIANSTLSNFLKNPCYKDIFTHDKSKKTILLHNAFKQAKSANFVILKDTEYNKLLSKNNSLLCSYYLFLKKHCSIANANSSKNDCTAKQFLQAIGRSSCAGNLQVVYSMNTELDNIGLIHIVKYRDSLGHSRNIFEIV